VCAPHAHRSETIVFNGTKNGKSWLGSIRKSPTKLAATDVMADGVAFQATVAT